MESHGIRRNSDTLSFPAGRSSRSIVDRFANKLSPRSPSGGNATLPREVPSHLPSNCTDQLSLLHEVASHRCCRSSRRPTPLQFTSLRGTAADAPFTYASLADLANNVPSEFSRNLALGSSSGEMYNFGFSVSDAWIGNAGKGLGVIHPQVQVGLRLVRSWYSPAPTYATAVRQLLRHPASRGCPVKHDRASRATLTLPIPRKDAATGKPAAPTLKCTPDSIASGWLQSPACRLRRHTQRSSGQHQPSGLRGVRRANAELGDVCGNEPFPALHVQRHGEHQSQSSTAASSPGL